MFVSIAIVCGLMTLVSTTLILATCLTASTARKTMLSNAGSTLGDIRPRVNSAYMAESAA